MQQRDERGEQQRGGVEVERERLARGAVGEARAGAARSRAATARWAIAAAASAAEQARPRRRRRARRASPANSSAPMPRPSRRWRRERSARRDRAGRAIVGRGRAQLRGIRQHERDRDQRAATSRTAGSGSARAGEARPRALPREPSAPASSTGRNGRTPARGREADAETDVEEEAVHAVGQRAVRYRGCERSTGSDDRRPAVRQTLVREVRPARRRIAREGMDRSSSGAGRRRGPRDRARARRATRRCSRRARAGMKRSAMRDMMALTERPDVISLAGGLPGHLDVPARARTRS